METREQLHTLIDELPSEVINNIMDYILQLETAMPCLQQQEHAMEDDVRLERNFQKILAEDDNLLRRLAQ